MQRKYLEALREWNKDPYRKPMIVWGARQVGKTYLVKDLFAEQEYKGRYIYVDCRVNYRFVDYCRKHVNDEEILSYLSLSHQREIGKDTLLIFDEAQECPELVTLLKYFCQNHREIPILLTGSMIRLRLKRDSNVRGQKDNNAFLFPIGKINELTVYPLTFGEFLYNRNAMLYKKVKEAYKEKKELSEAEHSMAMSVFYDYLLIGGMPEADRIFLETGSYQKARKTVIELYNHYLEDMPLYQASNESKLRSETIFKTIYSQLSKESKNFKPGIVQKGLRNRDLESPLDWLSLAHLVYRSTMVKERVSLPLMEAKEALYRLYLSDSGIFSYESQVEPTAFLSQTGRNTLSGIFFENYMATELVSHGFPLFYWRGKNDAEFEFLLQDKDAVVPIDVKKKKGTLNSLSKFIAHNKLDYAVKVSANRYDYDKEHRIRTLPFYDVGFYLEEVKERNDQIGNEIG